MTEVTRESLAAALQRIHDDPRPYDEIGFDFAALSYEAAADAILAALPEAAVQEPYRVATCPHCGEDLSIWRAAQPAPDPEAIRLLKAVMPLARHASHCFYPQVPCVCGFKDVGEQARSFLFKSEARESGGKP